VDLLRGQRLESRASRQYRSSALCRSGPAPPAAPAPSRWRSR
jgi:hypothetical protein